MPWRASIPRGKPGGIFYCKFLGGGIERGDGDAGVGADARDGRDAASDHGGREQPDEPVDGNDDVHGERAQLRDGVQLGDADGGRNHPRVAAAGEDAGRPGAGGGRAIPVVGGIEIHVRCAWADVCGAAGPAGDAPGLQRGGLFVGGEGRGGSAGDVRDGRAGACDAADDGGRAAG